MIIMKFGGTSVGSKESIANVCELVKGRLPRSPLLVTSAHGGKIKITDMLIETAELALKGKTDISNIEKRQLNLLQDLGLDVALVAGHLAHLHDIIKSISLIGELTARTLDLVVSFGERMAARVLAAVLVQKEINAVAIDSFELGLLTDNNYGAAQPLQTCYADIAAKVAAVEAEVIVTTGFIAKCENGHITTLGRGGSDYSATIFGAALKAEEVEIWTDVNGIMTADPSLCKAARSLPQVSFLEASELAWYGAQVLHPSSILPAVQNGIPVRVLNTMEPKNSGTVIVAKPDRSAVAKSIVYKEDLLLVDIISSRMLMSHGFMAKVFNIFEKHKIVINMIATSEITISLTTNVSKEQITPAIKELQEYGKVEVRDQHAIVCLIGEGMGGVPGTAAKTCAALAEAGINIQMISQGAREINIAVLVNNYDIEAAVKILHRKFFEKDIT